MQTVKKNRITGSFEIIAVLIVGLTLVLSSGCGKTPEPVPENEQSSDSTVVAQDQLAAQGPDAVRERLVGVWLGAAWMDEDALTKQLELLPEEKKAAVLRQANFFTTTLMAIDFREDGSLEHNVEVSPEAGQVESSEGFGTWRVVESSANGFVVEINEQQQDGSIATSQRAYKFYEDGNHFALSVPLGELLDNCNPVIVFERQNLDQEVVAEAPGDTNSVNR